MAIPLSYQISEYDCGPVTLINAISFLFDRRELAPDIVKGIYQYSLDGFNARCHSGKTGTSSHALHFLSDWLNHYAVPHKLPLHTEMLPREEIRISEDSRIVQALRSGGVALLRVMLDVGHYVLATGVEGRKLQIFDPYFMALPLNAPGIQMIYDHPTAYNRLVDWDRINCADKRYYALGDPEIRECMLLFNTRGTKLNPKSRHGCGDGFVKGICRIDAENHLIP